MPRATRLASELVRRRKPPPQRLIMSAAGELNASELNARVMAVSHRGRYRRPHLAKLVGEPMPRQFSELSNEVLCSMAATEHVRGAVKERLRREIMVVDECEYEEACERLTKMATAVPGQSLYKLPYVCGIVSAALTSAGSILCVFHRDTAIWFCERWVGDSVPELGELDTVWKVGAWTWTWMEPAIGTASFVLLVRAGARSNSTRRGCCLCYSGCCLSCCLSCSLKLSGHGADPRADGQAAAQALRPPHPDALRGPDGEVLNDPCCSHEFL